MVVRHLMLSTRTNTHSSTTPKYWTLTVTHKVVRTQLYLLRCGGEFSTVVRDDLFVQNSWFLIVLISLVCITRWNTVCVCVCVSWNCITSGRKCMHKVAHSGHQAVTPLTPVAMACTFVHLRLLATIKYTCNCMFVGGTLTTFTTVLLLNGLPTLEME